MTSSEGGPREVIETGELFKLQDYDIEVDCSREYCNGRCEELVSSKITKDFNFTLSDQLANPDKSIGQIICDLNPDRKPKWPKWSILPRFFSNYSCGNSKGMSAIGRQPTKVFACANGTYIDRVRC
jgi:hypothetical protein